MLKNFYVDTYTPFHGVVLRALSKLKSTEEIHDDGKYREDPMFSRISLRTTMAQEELEAWGYQPSYSDGFYACCEAPENLFE